MKKIVAFILVLVSLGLWLSSYTQDTTITSIFPAYPNDATKFLNGTGAWAVPAGSGGTNAAQSPWLSDINGNVTNSLNNVKAVFIKTSDFLTNSTALSITNGQNISIFTVNNAGQVGVNLPGGATALTEGFEQRGFANTNTDNFGIRSTWQVSGAGPTNAFHYAGMLGQIIIPSSETNCSPGWIAGMYAYAKVDGSTPIADVEGIRLVNRLNGNFGYISNWYGSYSDIHLTGTHSAASNIFHHYIAPVVRDFGASNTVVNEYGLYVGGMTSATNTYAIYTAGQANKIHFEGPVDVNSTISTDGSHQIQSDGTAALPGFSTAGNANMGMFRAANNQLGFSTVGVERMRFDASGVMNVGEVLVTNGITLGGVRITAWPTAVCGGNLSIAPTDAANSTCITDSGGSGSQILYAANQLGYYQFQVPPNWTGTLHIKGQYGMDVATSGTVILEADVWAMNSGDSRAFTNPNFGTANLITNTVPGTVYFPQSFDITCANVGGTLQTNSWVKVKLTRTGSAGNNMALQSLGYWNQ